jgi:hypothetical protein
MLQESIIALGRSEAKMEYLDGKYEIIKYVQQSNASSQYDLSCDILTCENVNSLEIFR